MATDKGGGMYNYNNSHPTVNNSILWGNTAGENPNQITNGPRSTLTITYSCIEGGSFAGEGNIYDDPLLISADNLRLQSESPCIDRGDNIALPGGITTDLDGNPRIVLGKDEDRVDIGAYEYQP